MKKLALFTVVFFMCLSVATALLGLPQSVQAAGTIYYVDADASGANNGSSWTDAYTDLQDALDAAISGDEIWVAEGTYKPTSGIDRTVSFQLKSGVALYGGFNGTETVREQRDWATNVTILSGDIGIPGDNSDNSYHVVVGANDANMDGFTVTEGNANGTGNNGLGSGMFNDNSSPMVTNCIFSSNSAWDGGGGMYNEHSSPTVINCVFCDNSAGWGGGMYNGYSSPMVTDCAFYSNSAINGGGGIINHDYSSPTVTNCIFYNNSSNRGWGGGMHNHKSSPRVTNCTFSSNSGGGILNWESSLTGTNCVLWNNGYEIDNDANSTALVTYSNVQGGYPGEGNINANPMFVDPTGGNYHLQGVSPCIDTGTNEGAPTEDIEGNPRPFDGDGDGIAITDMGAYEYVPHIVGGTVVEEDIFEVVMPWIIVVLIAVSGAVFCFVVIVLTDI